jgi:hypothetical protein
MRRLSGRSRQHPHCGKAMKSRGLVVLALALRFMCALQHAQCTLWKTGQCRGVSPVQHLSRRLGQVLSDDALCVCPGGSRVERRGVCEGHLCNIMVALSAAAAVHCGKVHTLQHDPHGNLLQRLNCKHTWLYDILGGKQVTVSSSLTCKQFTSLSFSSLDFRASSPKMTKCRTINAGPTCK